MTSTKHDKFANRFYQASEEFGPKLTADPRLPVLTPPLPPRPPLFALHRIKLKNFRGIEHQEMPLQNTTVLVGDNGQGKTTWLEAIAGAVGTFLTGLGFEDAPDLKPSDVRQVIRPINDVFDRQPQLPMQIEIEATVEAVSLTWRRHIESLSSQIADVKADGLQVVAQRIAKEIQSHAERPLPVLAYYGTQRLWPPEIQADKERREVGSRLDGYRDCLKAASTHQHMLNWVRRYTFTELQRKQPVVQLRAIKNAVVACIEEAKDFAYDVALEDLVLTLHDDEVVPFRILSDGYRNMVATVADIAWRASVLNPHLGERAPVMAEGVVLIDEIDLHLHPKWQRRVLADLRRAFPKLQFITTSHSPFIIQSMEPGQLVNLNPNLDSDSYSQGSPEDIAEHVMGVEVPQRSERRRKEYEVAKKYYDLLDRMPHADEAELGRLKNELDILVASYSDNQAFVAFLERKRALAEAKRS